MAERNGQHRALDRGAPRRARGVWELQLFRAGGRFNGAWNPSGAMIAPADTTDARLESWLPVLNDSDFPIQNLPFGVFKSEARLPRIGVAIGDGILDLYAVAEAALLDECCEPELLQAPLLNPLMAAGRAVWSPLRERLSRLLRRGGD